MDDPLIEWAKRAFGDAADFYLREAADPGAFDRWVRVHRRERRRRRLKELWRINQRLRDGVETPESLASLADRRSGLVEKLGGEHPWGPRALPLIPTDVSG